MMTFSDEVIMRTVTMTIFYVKYVIYRSFIEKSYSFISVGLPGKFGLNLIYI